MGGHHQGAQAHGRLSARAAAAGAPRCYCGAASVTEMSVCTSESGNRWPAR